MSKKIFVVEDDATLRNVLLEKLSKSGYAVEGAEDGEAALQKLQNGLRPDLMLLDILMPRKNGMEVMEEVNANPVLKNIPIMIISNSGQPVEIERAKELGAKDFLIKAVFDPAEVLEKVQNLLSEGGESPVSDALQPEKKESAQQVVLSEAPAPDETGGQPEAQEGHGVLVVEDDKFLRELFVRKLFSSGFTVENASDAKEAFAVLERWKPDLILLDLMLPDIDGFEILARLKKDERFVAIPVFILSNLGEQKDIDRAMNLGAQGFMVKVNFNLEDIVSRVQEVLNGIKK